MVTMCKDLRMHAARRCKLPREHRMGFLRVRARGQRPPRQHRLGRGDGAGRAGLCGDGTVKMTYTAFDSTGRKRRRRSTSATAHKMWVGETGDATGRSTGVTDG